MTELERAFALLGLGDQAGTRAERSRFGTAVFHDELPRRWDSNYLLVDPSAGGLTAEELNAEADRLQGGAGLAHRKLTVRDEQTGARLEPELRALGWKCQRLLVMVHRRGAERTADLSIVEEVEEEALRPFRTRATRELPFGRDPETARQLVAAKRFLAHVVRARFFAVRTDGEIVSCAELYSGGGTGQIEDVVTLERYRGRGYASAIVLKALEESRKAGNDLTFLLADESDWPKDLYGRLGFEAVGRTYEFLRPPA